MAAVEDIASNVAVLTQRLTDHTEQDDINFGRLSNKLDGLDEKMDLLLIYKAFEEGEAKGMRRSVYVIATLVSMLIGAISWAAPYFVNG